MEFTLPGLIQSVQKRDEPGSGIAGPHASTIGSRKSPEPPTSLSTILPASVWEAPVVSKPSSSPGYGHRPEINAGPTPMTVSSQQGSYSQAFNSQSNQLLDDLFGDEGQDREKTRINHTLPKQGGSTLPPQNASATQPPSSNSTDLTSPALPQLYSPTKQEIQLHPITQRLSKTRDEIVTGIGCAPEVPPEEERTATESRQENAVASAPDTMADKGIKEGDDVSWQWSGGRPGGTVAEVAKEGEIAIESKRGNTIKKNADPENPAVHIERSGNDVVKRASELDVEMEGDRHKEGAGDDKKDEKKEEANGEKKEEANGEKEHNSKTGEKRNADETAEEKKDEEGDVKRQKTDKPTANGEKAAQKKKGRPAKTDTNGISKTKSEPKKKREPKKAATENGEPRRSARNRS